MHVTKEKEKEQHVLAMYVLFLNFCAKHGYLTTSSTTHLSESNSFPFCIRPGHELRGTRRRSKKRQTYSA